MKKNSLLLLLLLSVLFGNTQVQVEKNEELGEIIRLAGAAQDIPYVTAELTTIVGDSANWGRPGIDQDTVGGVYKQADGRIWARMGNVEYVQGFSYNLVLFHGDSVVTINKATPTNFGLQLNLLDSTFLQAHVQGMAILEYPDGRRVFKLNFYPQSLYSGYEMTYNKSTYKVESVIYYIKNGYANDDGVSSTAKIITTFYGYSLAPFDKNILNEDNFIYKDGSVYKPRALYNGYKIITISLD